MYSQLVVNIGNLVGYDEILSLLGKSAKPFTVAEIMLIQILETFWKISKTN